MKLPDLVLFVGLPYAAMLVFLIGTIQRYRSRGFKVSSLSSQFLEGRRLLSDNYISPWGKVIDVAHGDPIGARCPFISAFSSSSSDI